MDYSETMNKFFLDQLSVWPLARDNFRALKDVRTRSLTVGGLEVTVQYNPARAISTNARTDAASLAARPCFLCQCNRPVQQGHLDFEGTKRKRYHIVVNPFPILQNHFVIAADTHIPQNIAHRFIDILRLCKRHREYTFIYNGPKSGASAPDHFHFQAFPCAQLPLEADVRLGNSMEFVSSVRDAALYHYTGFARGIFVIRGKTSKSVAKMFYRLLDCVPLLNEGDVEPGINLFSYYSEEEYCTIIVLRSVHRSSHYWTEDPELHLSMSPGCVDMGGIFITVEESDYEKLTPSLLKDVLDEITVSDAVENKILNRLTRSQVTVNVDLGRTECLDFEIVSDGAGVRRASLRDGKVEYGGILYDELYFEAKTLSTMFAETSFIIHDGGAAGNVRSYAGALMIVSDGDALKVVNILGVEDLLCSILSSAYPDCDDTLMLARKAVNCRKEVLLCDGEIHGDPFGHRYCGTMIKQTAGARKAVEDTWGVTC